MEINDKKIKNMGLCLFLGIVSIVFVWYAFLEDVLALLISSLIVGFLANGLELFDKYDEVITAAIYEFIVVFISLEIFVPFSSLISAVYGGVWTTAILIWACIGAVIAAIVSFVKIYYLNKENPKTNSNNFNNKSLKANDTENIQFTDCPECGSMIRIDSIFCESCGSKIDTIVKDTVCMNCGSKLEKDSLFCDNCGTKKQ